MNARITRGRRAVAAAAVVLLATGAAACEDDGSGKPATPSAEPTPAGVDPVWLVRSTGTRESTEYTARQQALFVDGDIGVYAVHDSVIGLSLEDGTEVWSNPIDLRGEEPSVIGRQATKDHHWHYSSSQPYEAGERMGDRLYTVDVRTGTVVNDVEAPSYTGDIVNVDGTDYLAMDDTVHRITPEGELVTVWTVPARLRKHGRYINDVAPVAGTSTVVVSLDYYNGSPLTFVGLDVSTGTELWSRSAAKVRTKPFGNVADIRTGPDGRLLVQRYYRKNTLASWTHLWLIDPTTGATRYHRLLETSSDEGQQLEHGYQLWDTGTDDTDAHGVQLVGDHDLILRDKGAATRYDIAKDENVWRYDLGTYVHLGPLTADGERLVVNVPGYTTGAFHLVDAATGELVASWSLPVEYAEGLSGSPLIAFTADGMVLGRNQGAVGGLEADESEATAALNDVGLFRYRY